MLSYGIYMRLDLVGYIITMSISNNETNRLTTKLFVG